MGGVDSRQVHSLRDVKPGDHIKYHKFVMLYAHHAIVVDVNPPYYTIIHFDGDNNAGKGVKANILQAKCKFGEDNFEVLDYPPEERFTREETIAVAYYVLGIGFGSYNLFMNNCEHFATTCATGYPCSIQTLRMAVLTNPTFGIEEIIAYCKTKKIVFISKVRGRFEITLSKE